eukprot:gene34490-biopygen89371
MPVSSCVLQTNSGALAVVSSATMDAMAMQRAPVQMTTIWVIGHCLLVQIVCPDMVPQRAQLNAQWSRARCAQVTVCRQSTDGGCDCWQDDDLGHWTGVVCDTTCFGHGSCVDGRLGNGECVCDSGWAGSGCSTGCQGMDQGTPCAGHGVACACKEVSVPMAGMETGLVHATGGSQVTIARKNAEEAVLTRARATEYATH